MNKRNKTYYELLQITEDASDEVIKASYLALVKKYHPDNNPGFKKESEEIITNLNHAYEILSDPIKKSEYDRSLLAEKRSSTISYDTDNSTKRSTIFATSRLSPIVLVPLMVIGFIIAFEFFLKTDNTQKPDYSQATEISSEYTSESIKNTETFENLTAYPLPANGEIFKGSVLLKEYEDYPNKFAPLEIQSSDTSINYYIKLKNINNNLNDIVFFVRGGSDVIINIPVGYYKMYYIVGSIWYGRFDLFGPESTYYKSDDILTFSYNGTRSEGCSITLYEVPNGNFETYEIDPNEF